MTPALGIALGSGYPAGFFSETMDTLGAVRVAAQLLPTTVVAPADPVDINAIAIALAIINIMNRFLMPTPVVLVMPPRQAALWGE
jgi:hypothetical protein